MPTPLPPGEKTAFIALVNVRNPTEAVRLATLLNNYEDIKAAIGRQLDDFAANPQYLIEGMAVFTPAALTAVGIVNGVTTNVVINDPVLWVNSSTTGGIVITANNKGFAILGNSQINNITVNAARDLDRIYIGPGSLVNIMDSTAAGAFINNIYIACERGTPGSLNTIKYGSMYGSLQIDPGAYFGGIENVDVTAPCGIPVINMIATQATDTSVLVSWVPPGAGGFLSIDMYFRKSGDQLWILANGDDGTFVDLTGFVFRRLERNTYYDFKAVVTCNNGGVANTIITAQTTSCGIGNQLALYKDCKVTIYIKAVPDPNPLTNIQYLCNGATIAKEYPQGTTLTIPYFAGPGKNILAPFVIDNANVSDLVFDPITGKWDASGSTILSFSEPMVIELNVSLPV